MLFQLLLVATLTTTGESQPQYDDYLNTGDKWSGRSFGPDVNEQRVTKVTRFVENGNGIQNGPSGGGGSPPAPYGNLVEACKTGAEKLKKICGSFLGPSGGAEMEPWKPNGAGSGGMTTVFPWGPGRPGEGTGGNNGNGGWAPPPYGPPGINPGAGGPGGWNPNGVYPPLGNGLYPTPDGSGGYGEPYGGSDSYPFRDGEGDIRVRKFSPPYIGDDYDDEDFVDRLKKTMQSAINEAVGKQLYQDRVPMQDYKADFVRLKLKYHPIKCSAVFTESAVYNKNQRYRSSGYKCLVHHRKVVGICATSCPPANVGKCCNSNKDAYIQSVPNKYSKLAVKLLIQYPLLRQWPKKKWSYVLSKAMELLQDGKYKRAFSKASFDFD